MADPADTPEGVLIVEMQRHRARAHGSARQIAELMRKLDGPPGND